MAPTNTSPGLKNETVPDSSTPARSNGAANQADAGALVLFPDASLTTAVNFTFWPTEMSDVAGVSSATFVEVGAEVCYCAAEIAAVAMATSRATHRTASKLRRVRIMILLNELFSEW